MEVFLRTWNIQKITQIMTFMAFSKMAKFEPVLKIRKIISRVNFRIFEIHREMPEFGLIMFFGFL